MNSLKSKNIVMIEFNNKAIAMVRGKSPLSEHVWEKSQVEPLFLFKRGFGSGDNFIYLSKYQFFVFLQVYFNKNVFGLNQYYYFLFIGRDNILKVKKN